MATTLHRIESLAVGIRDSTGAAVASGKVRFYQPGTTTPQTVYQDDAAGVAVSVPLTLDAGGRATAYMLSPVRMVVKDSTDTTTILDTVLDMRAEQVFVTNTNINSGAETTVDQALTQLATQGFQYQESPGATARSVLTVLGERCVSITDFNAVGDNATDNTARIQAAVDRVAARGGGIVLIPYGNFRTTGFTISTPGVCVLGTGPGSVLVNTSTTTSVITINTGAAADSKVSLRDFSITHTSTSSGAGVLFTSGDRGYIENVRVSLHRTGFGATVSSGTKFVGCTVLSTDDNASAFGFLAGPYGRLIDCEAISGTTNGTGFWLYTNARARDCYVSKFAIGANLAGDYSSFSGDVVNATTGASIGGAGASFIGFNIAGATTGITGSGNSLKVSKGSVVATGGGVAFAGTYCDVAGVTVTGGTTAFSLGGAGCAATLCTASGSTTGFSLAAAGSSAVSCRAATCTTGFSVAAVAGTRVSNNYATGCTTDLSVTAGATNFISSANEFNGTISEASGARKISDGQFGLQYPSTTQFTTAITSAAPTLTPTVGTLGRHAYSYFYLSGGVGATATMAAPSGPTYEGAEITIVIRNASGGNVAVSLNAVYHQLSALTTAALTSVTVTSGNFQFMRFRYDSTAAKWVTFEVYSSNAATPVVP